MKYFKSFKFNDINFLNVDYLDSVAQWIKVKGTWFKFYHDYQYCVKGTFKIG